MISLIVAPNKAGHITDTLLVADSNNKNNNGFKYVVDLKVTGLSFWGQNYLRFFIPPRVTDGRLYFNISEAIRDIVSCVLPSFNSSYIESENGYAGRKMFIDIGEAYFTSPTTYSIFPALASNTFYGYFYTYHRASDFSAFTATTDRRRIKKFFAVPFNRQWCNLVFTSNNISSGTIRGNLMGLPNSGTYAGQLPTNMNISNDDIVVANFNLGGYYDTTNGDYVPNILAFFDDDVLRLQQEYYDGSNWITEVAFEWQVVKCLKNEGLMLYWINDKGQVDAWYFPVFKRFRNITTTDITLPKSQVVPYTFGDRYYSRYDETIRAFSYQTTSEAEAEAIAEVANAKYVWFNTADDADLKQTFVLERNIEIKKYKTDKVFQVVLTLANSYSIKA